MAGLCADGFNAALTYALSAIGKEGLELKQEQERAIRHMYDGDDVFFLVVVHRFWEESLLRMPALSFRP